MKRADEEQLKVTLTAAIDEWIDGQGMGDDAPILPYVGANISEIMATAALAVLRGMDDAQDYLRENQMLKED